MNRFILYSGLAHAALFMGALTYLATEHQDPRDPSVQSVVEMELPTAATRNTPAVEEPQAANSEVQDAIPHEAPATTEANKVELRERKVRASLPTAPAVPRIVERVEKVTGEKQLPTSLPEKKTATTQIADAPVIQQSREEENLPEMGKDVPTFVAEDVKELDQQKDDDMSEMDAIAADHMKRLNQEEETAPAVKPQAIPAGYDKAENHGGEGSGIDGAANHPQPGETKALAEFKQKAGNKTPAYDTKDRLEGKQGLVVFLAYVTNSGATKDFQLVTSSGHRSLDVKTLAAVKTWKFQPGQEGWVEIPFQWDLKGGVQEAPSTLRRMNRTAN